MKFAFIIMGNFDSGKDHAEMQGESVRMIGVSSIEEACKVAKGLQAQGIDCIELCGAFEESGARKVIEATNNKIPVGYVTHLPEQDPLFKALFG